MKLLIKVAVSTVLAVAIGGCSLNFDMFGSDKSQEAITVKKVAETNIGLRKTDLYNENTTVADKTEYATTQAGSGYKYQRAFENAPPMIPHDISDFVPITKDNNACLGCHSRDVAKDVGATAIPDSHYTNLRTNTKLNDLYQGRHNCTQCHAPQSQGNPLVENNFEPDFKTKDGQNKSHLMDTLNEGVK